MLYKTNNKSGQQLLLKVHVYNSICSVNLTLSISADPIKSLPYTFFIPSSYFSVFMLADKFLNNQWVCLCGCLLNVMRESTYCWGGQDKSIIFMIERMALPCARSDNWLNEVLSLFAYDYCSHFARNYSRFWMCRLGSRGRVRACRVRQSLS